MGESRKIIQGGKRYGGAKKFLKLRVSCGGDSKCYSCLWEAGEPRSPSDGTLSILCGDRDGETRSLEMLLGEKDMVCRIGTKMGVIRGNAVEGMVGHHASHEQNRR